MSISTLTNTSRTASAKEPLPRYISQHVSQSARGGSNIRLHRVTCTPSGGPSGPTPRGSRAAGSRRLMAYVPAAARAALRRMAGVGRLHFADVHLHPVWTAHLSDALSSEAHRRGHGARAGTAERRHGGGGHGAGKGARRCDPSQHRADTDSSRSAALWRCRCRYRDSVRFSERTALIRTEYARGRMANERYSAAGVISVGPVKRRR